ncbi:phosphotransferase [Celeribacter sp. ULVN23_4]
MTQPSDPLDLAQNKLSELFRERPHLAARAEDVELLRTRGERAAFSLHWDGRPAVAKLIWHSEKVRAVSGQTGALKELVAHLGAGPAQVPEVLHIAPKAGFFVISRVVGTSAEDILRHGGEKEIPGIAKAAAFWMSHASGLRRETKAFPFDWFEDRLDTFTLGIAADVAARTRELLKTAPNEITFWAGHGDFWPGNLMLDGKTVTAIDLAGRRDIPLIEDYARFAMGLTIYSEEGLTRKITDPLLQGLPGNEAKRAFPIFYGLLLAQKIQASGGLKHAHERARFLAL